MLATIEKKGERYVARFERELKHPEHEVWSWLTDNVKLVQWFAELQVGELREGGFMKFDMQDGTFEELEILEFQSNSILAFAWWEDNVHFEIILELDGCRLILTETIARMTDHTPKDLAGWHVCLDVISERLEGITITSEERKEEWKTWYEKYVLAIQAVSGS